MNEQEEEFGLDRIIEALGQLKNKPAERIVEGLISEVRGFAGEERSKMDDLTLLVIKILKDKEMDTSKHKRS